MLDGHDVQRGVERSVAKRQRSQIADRVQPPVIPRIVPDPEVDREVSLLPEIGSVLRFSRTRVQHTRALRQRVRERRHGAFNLHFEMQDVPAQGPRQPVCQIGITHRRRASIMTVDPAWNAASNAVNGRLATTSAKYSRSRVIRVPPPSFTRRTRRAIGSSRGARLLASPAGLSRKEKYLRRSTSNPHCSSNCDTCRDSKSKR